MEATKSYVQQDRKRRTHKEDGPSIYAWLFATGGLSLIFAVAYLPEYKLLEMPRAFNLFVFRSMWNIRAVFLTSVALHVVEAIYAWNLAKRVDPGNVLGWFLQTLALGFFSLRFLLKKASAARKDY